MKRRDSLSSISSFRSPSTSSSFSYAILVAFILAFGLLSFCVEDAQCQDVSNFTISLGDWPMLGFDTRRTNCNPYGLTIGKYSPTPPQRYKQTAQLYLFSINSGTVLGLNGTVYQASINVNSEWVMTALQIGSNGGWTTLWTQLLVSGSSNLAPTATLTSNGTLIMPTPTFLFALSIQTGDIIWQAPFEATESSPVPSKDGKHLYIGTADGFLAAFDVVTGRMIWRHPTEAPVHGSPALAENGDIVVGSTDGALYRVTPEGRLVWSFQTNHFIYCTPAIDTKGFIYFASYDRGIFSLYPNGTQRWNYATVEDISRAVSIDEKRQLLFAGTTVNHVFALNLTTGEMLWTRDFSQPVTAPIVIDGHGNVHVGCQDGNYYIFSSGGTMLFNLGLNNAIINSPAVNKERLILSSGGWLYALEPDPYSDVPWFETEEFIIIVSACVGALFLFVVCGVGVTAFLIYRVNKKHKMKEGLNKELVANLVARRRRDRLSSSSDEEEPLLVEDMEADYPMLRDLGGTETFAITKEWEGILQKACKEKWYIPFKGLILEEKIAVGGVGTIYRAKWRGTDVAVKTMTGGFMPLAKFKGEQTNTSSVDEFIKEIGLLATLRHPNIVMFLGATVIPTGGLGYAIVTEFCSLGSLWDVLHDPSMRFDWSTVMRLAHGIAAGMEYLHSHPVPILHRDLKSPNVLVLNDLTPRITDFGLSKFRPEDNTKSLTFQIGSPFWMPPEMMTNTRYTEKADVYSYGIILWEILTREEPFKDIPIFKIYTVVTSGERPKIPPWCPENYAMLMERCWAPQQENRPFFPEILDLLTHCEDEGDHLTLPLPPPEDDEYSHNSREERGYPATSKERRYPATSKERREKSAGSALGTSFEAPSGGYLRASRGNLGKSQEKGRGDL